MISRYQNQTHKLKTIHVNRNHLRLKWRPPRMLRYPIRQNHILSHSITIKKLTFFFVWKLFFFCFYFRTTKIVLFFDKWGQFCIHDHKAKESFVQRSMTTKLPSKFLWFFLLSSSLHLFIFFHQITFSFLYQNTKQKKLLFSHLFVEDN